MLYLLDNRVIVMTIARKTVERGFILIQLFLLLEKTRVIVCALEIHIWLRLNGLFDFCISWNHQEIINFLMVLGERQSLTGLLELV